MFVLSVVIACSLLYNYNGQKMERSPIKCWDCLKKSTLLRRCSSCSMIKKKFSFIFAILSWISIIWLGCRLWRLWILWYMKTPLCYKHIGKGEVWPFTKTEKNVTFRNCLNLLKHIFYKNIMFLYRKDLKYRSVFVLEDRKLNKSACFPCFGVCA